jgi:hypothetical protein
MSTFLVSRRNSEPMTRGIGAIAIGDHGPLKISPVATTIVFAAQRQTTQQAQDDQDDRCEDADAGVAGENAAQEQRLLK